jgi:hypothetical protein
MEHATFAIHFLGRIDQVLYPFYKKTVEDDKRITREEALELLECFLVKFNEPAWALNYEWSQWATGQGLSQTMVIGGQTGEGKDACNEVTLLVLEAMEQLRESAGIRHEGMGRNARQVPQEGGPSLSVWDLAIRNSCDRKASRWRPKPTPT